MKQLLNLYAVAPLALLMLASQPAKAGDYGFNYITKGGRIILKDSTMMHEMRQTPSYYNENEGVSNLTHPHYIYNKVFLTLFLLS